MTDPALDGSAPPSPGSAPAPLRCGVVLRVGEELCEVVVDGEVSSAAFAPSFPSPRAERVAPGHLVALAPTSRGTAALVWR